MGLKMRTEERDPRIRRTRQLLVDALDKLLQQKSFDEISVQDITDTATVNRATFYDHYGDKFRLLEAMVGWRFHELLAERQLALDSSCSSALRAFVLAVCDYLVALLGPAGDRRVEPHMESAIAGVLRSAFLEGLREHPWCGGAPDGMAAAAAAWAIYGATKEWAQMRNRPPAEQIAGTVAGLVAPLLHGAPAAEEEAAAAETTTGSGAGFVHASPTTV